MRDFRILATNLTFMPDLQFTYQKDDRTAEGTWYRPNTPLLIFADHVLDGTSFTNHGGPIAGAPEGHPLRLVFWGDWWLNAGKPARIEIESSTQALLQSRYFSELTQYGIPSAPVWGGAIVVTEPTAPASAPDVRTISEKVVDLIDDLIDDDVFPDPDDGPRNLFVVVLPDGFTLDSNDADGAHRSDYDFDFPFDTDRFWAGWVRPQADRQTMMRVISHEVVEMMTDPEADAWHTEHTTGTNEVSDAGFSGGIPARPGVAQTAFVNGVRVQSYWSEKIHATVIPVDLDYGARLSATIRETGRRILTHGTFRIDESDRIGCPAFHECCIEDREYDWRVYGLDERARITAQWTRFAQPVFNWTINGTPITAGTITLHLDAEEFSGRTAIVTNRPVTLSFSHPPGMPHVLDVFANNPGCNFEITVGCRITDDSITGNVATDIIALPTITIGFTCADLLLEDAYIRQKAACYAAMIKRYVYQYKPTGKIRPEHGINWDFSELLRNRPAYFKPSHYQQLRWLIKVGRAAHALLEREQAIQFTKLLSEHAGVLSRTLIVRNDHNILFKESKE